MTKAAVLRNTAAIPTRLVVVPASPATLYTYCLLYQLLHNLISKELTKYGERIALLNVGR